MTEDSVKELVKEVLAKNLRTFVGVKVDQNTAEQVKAQTIQTLLHLASLLDINHNIPDVRVSITGNEVTIKFYNTRDSQELSLADWILGNL